MKPISITVCPGTLTLGYTTYSTSALRALFNGHKVSHLLAYENPVKDEETNIRFIENRERISISGVQEKVSLRLEKNVLRLTEKGEHGTHILKPVPRDLMNVQDVPANEHLTMQIASQVYGIETAANALVFFKDGTPAYLTRRFDLKEDGTKWGVEDFASLAGKTSDNDGPDFKYNSNYETVGSIIRQFMPAWRIEIEKYFVRVLFNYLFSNGDAHLKNFSAIETENQDYLLSPAYDLINSRIHVNDSDFALDGGLFDGEYKSSFPGKKGQYTALDFREFARRIKVQEHRIDRLMEQFLVRQVAVEDLIKRSFLSDKQKRGYLQLYQMKRNYLIASEGSSR